MAGVAPARTARLSVSAVRALLVAAAALALALLTGQPLLAALAAPFLLAWSPAPSPGETTVDVEPRLAVVGDRLVAIVRTHAPAGTWLCRVQVWSDDGAVRLQRRVLAPAPGPITVTVPLSARRRGRLSVPRVRLELRSPVGTEHVHDLRLQPPLVVPVVPVGQAPDLELLLRASRTASGAHLSRAAGSGEDFRGVREVHRGDDLRQVNWRATQRLGHLMLDERTAERGADVVLLVGTGRASEDDLEAAVAAAAGLLGQLLARGDRARLAEAGPRSRISPPLTGRGGGLAGAHWLVDVEAATQDVEAALRPDHPALRPGSAVVLLGSVLDRPAVALLVALRRRGHPVLLHDLGSVRRRDTDSLDRSEQPAQRLAAVRRADAALVLRTRGVLVVFADGALRAAPGRGGAPAAAETP